MALWVDRMGGTNSKSAIGSGNSFFPGGLAKLLDVFVYLAITLALDLVPYHFSPPLSLSDTVSSGIFCRSCVTGLGHSHVMSCQKV